MDWSTAIEQDFGLAHSISYWTLLLLGTSTIDYAVSLLCSLTEDEI